MKRCWRLSLEKSYKPTEYRMISFVNKQCVRMYYIYVAIFRNYVQSKCLLAGWLDYKFILLFNFYTLPNYIRDYTINFANSS